MRNIALRLQYNGSAYHGWQRQDNARSVEQVLQMAIEQISGEQIVVYGCGRTDAGVHALNYVCNFISNTKIPDEKIPFALNCILPYDIRITSAKTVPDDFHARYCVKKKCYMYKILNAPHADVFMKDLAWHYRHSLDIEKMSRACKAFIGEHDFSAFCASDAQTKTFTRTIYSLDAKKEGDIITVCVCGNGFLYNMVRIITGTLVYVGDGRIDEGDIEKIINSRDRRLAGITAPACGLYMKDVDYGFDIF